MRLRLVAGRARLEIRESFKTSFAEIKPNQIFHLSQRIDADSLNLAASSAFLWGTLEPQFQYGADSSSLSYDNPNFQRLLFRVLDTPALRDRVVNEAETPYAFSSERLQWTLQDAAGPDDDYTLLLLSVILDTSETDLTPAEIKLLLDARGGFVRLRGKGWLWSQKGNAGRTVLVVCPKSVMDNWRSETARFTADIRPRMWSAGELEQLPKETASADLHIINYSQLRSLGESLASLRWLAVILDEGQYIKNPSSQTAQVARSLVADHRLVLTGTPIENRLLDLWSLMTFAMPGVLGSRTMFNRQFSGKDDPHARRRLSARVRPFLVRRTKSQVAKDLPDKIEEDLFCEMEGEQRTLYRAELKRAQQMLLKVQTSKQLNQERFNVLTSLLRLRQICCDPRLVKADSRRVRDLV